MGLSNQRWGKLVLSDFKWFLYWGKKVLDACIDQTTGKWLIPLAFGQGKRQASAARQAHQNNGGLDIG